MMIKIFPNKLQSCLVCPIPEQRVSRSGAWQEFGVFKIQSNFIHKTDLKHRQLTKVLYNHNGAKTIKQHSKIMKTIKTNTKVKRKENDSKKHKYQFKRQKDNNIE